MSLRLEMLQVARLAPNLLGDSTDLVREFVSSQFGPKGGFANRVGADDLYYTVFGLDLMTALRMDIPVDQFRAYLESAAPVDELDLVHLACLTHCWASIDPHHYSDATRRAEVQSALEKFRADDGGVHPTPGSKSGTAYAAFLCCGIHGNIGANVPNPMKLVQSLKLLERKDGGWANESHAPMSATNSTAAAIGALHFLRMPIGPSVAEWILAQFHSQGGFVAAPQAPMPDLLSTATAIHSLATLEAPIEPIADATLDFIDSLWTNRGGFHGHWADEDLDCEYTFYGLLALGHLSVAEVAGSPADTP